jgi:hypothetical protein
VAVDGADALGQPAQAAVPHRVGAAAAVSQVRRVNGARRMRRSGELEP